MSWHFLGTLTLSENWQFVTQPAILTDLFRIRQHWSVPEKPIGKVLIAQFYNQQPVEIFGIKGFYASTDFKLIEMPVPKDLQFTGMVTRNLGMKLASNRINNSGWQISVDQFI